MSHSFRHLVFLLLVACLTVAPAAAVEWETRSEGRVIAVSDIHGAFDEFRILLQGLGLVDDAGRWIGSADHLVIIGDVLDRGAASRDVLEMIMRLEDEAGLAGGGVHMVLGNHEIMNLVGDLRYVAIDEYARYQDLEDPAQRDEALTRFRRQQPSRQLDEAAVLAAFTQAYPPGYFGHREQFSTHGRFGAWLLARPAVIKINDSAFAHGGLSKAVSGASLADINSHHRQVLLDYVVAMEHFIASGLLDVGTNFYDHPRIVKRALEAMNAADRELARRMLAAYDSDIFAPDSPTWYRGNVGCSVAIEQARLQLLLEGLGAKRLLVGHTPTASRTIESRFDDMLIRVDTGILNSHYRGQPAAAVIADGNVTAYYPSSASSTALTRQPRRVGPRPGRLTDTELERVLATAPIQSSEARRNRPTQVIIDYEGRPLEALFSAGGSTRDTAFFPEVAAYRLDRYLGLEMIPASVLRSIDGNDGSMVLDMEDLIDEEHRVARGADSDAWCPLQDQFNMMYLLDILVYNKGRGKNTMRYSSGDMRLVLTGFENTLGTERRIPRYLKSVPVSIPADVQMRLQALDSGLLDDMLGDVLDAKRRKALLQRRSLLLQRVR